MTQLFVLSFLKPFFTELSEFPGLKNLPGNLSIFFANFSSTSALVVVGMFLDSVLGPLLWLYSSPDDVLLPQCIDIILMVMILNMYL